MKFLILPVLAALSSLARADPSTSTDNDVFSPPKSTDASSFLSDVWSGQTATPTWATGKYATKLASALYSVETSFILRDDYTSIVDGVWSAASKDGQSSVLASLSSSYWDWSAVTTNGWYQDNMPKSFQTAVASYDSSWDSVITSVEAKATGKANAAAVPRCTGMAVAGVAFGVAAVAGVM